MTKFAVSVAVVITGSNEEETKLALYKSHVKVKGKVTYILGIPEYALKEDEASGDLADKIIKEHIENFNPNLLFIDKARFVQGITNNEIILIYKVNIPLDSTLKHELEWVSAEEANESKDEFEPEHFNIIKVALLDGHTTNGFTETVY